MKLQISVFRFRVSGLGFEDRGSGFRDLGFGFLFRPHTRLLQLRYSRKRRSQGRASTLLLRLYYSRAKS